MSDAFFRAGVGAVVLDDHCRILVLKRKGVSDNSWQLPQGGIGGNELPVEAIYRELSEETGLARDDLEIVKTISEWLVYELPPTFRNPKVGWGQAQRWFLCRLLAPHIKVHPDQIEVTEADWVTPNQLLARAVEFRIPVYQRVLSEFSLRDAAC
jgi:putative (di)nucleoside polyphosphate hydrolase